MKKYRKKPIVIVVIEAEQWFPVSKIDGVMEHIAVGGSFVTIITLEEGKMDVNPGDWVITGIKGEKYPCRPNIFEDTYEEVN